VPVVSMIPTIFIAVTEQTSFLRDIELHMLVALNPPFL
jgi:hypothetical protein